MFAVSIQLTAAGGGTFCYPLCPPASSRDVCPLPVVMCGNSRRREVLYLEKKRWTRLTAEGLELTQGSSCWVNGVLECNASDPGIQ